MKKMICLLMIVPLLILCSLNAVAQDEFQSKLVVNYVSMGDFQTLMKTGNINLLMSKNLNSDSYCVVKDEYTGENSVQKTSILNGKENSYIQDAMFWQINYYVPVSEPLIRFLSSNQEVQKYFASKGIKCNVQQFIVLGSWGSLTFDIPVSVFVKTDAGNYVLTLNEDYPYLDGNSISDQNDLYLKYHVKLYTLEDFYNKYKEKDGKIQYNSQEIPGEYYCKFVGQGAFVSLRSILENLDCQILWDQATKEIRLIYKDNEMSLNLKTDGSFVMLRKNHDVSFTYGYQNIDGRTVVDCDTMSAIVHYLYGNNVNLILNAESLIIRITANT